MDKQSVFQTDERPESLLRTLEQMEQEGVVGKQKIDQAFDGIQGRVKSIGVIIESLRGGLIEQLIRLFQLNAEGD